MQVLSALAGGVQSTEEFLSPGATLSPEGTEFWSVTQPLTLWRGTSQAHPTWSFTGSAKGLSPVAYSIISSVGFFSCLASDPNPYSLLLGATFPITASSQSLSWALSSGKHQLRPKTLEVAPSGVDQHLRDQ